MQINKRGMTAFVDAVVFMLVIMLAVSVTVHYTDGAREAEDASALLEDLTSVEVRLSDLTVLDDDSLAYLPDLLAYAMETGDTTPIDYAKDVLDVSCSGHAYVLTLRYMGEEMRIGDGDGTPARGTSMEVTLSTGGSLSMGLDLFS